MEYTCTMHGHEFRTNKIGDGLWIHTTEQAGQDWDSLTKTWVPAWRWKQIEGTADFCANNDKNFYHQVYRAYRHVYTID